MTAPKPAELVTSVLSGDGDAVLALEKRAGELEADDARRLAGFVLDPARGEGNRRQVAGLLGRSAGGFQ